MSYLVVCSSALYLPEGRGSKGCLALVASLMPSCCSNSPCSSQDTSQPCVGTQLGFLLPEECPRGWQSSRLLQCTAAPWLSDRTIFPGESDHLLSFSKIHLFFLSRNTTVFLTWRTILFSPVRTRKHPLPFLTEKRI